MHSVYQPGILRAFPSLGLSSSRVKPGYLVYGFPLTVIGAVVYVLQSLSVLRSELITTSNRWLKQATFLNHGRQPEVNISHARTVVSPRFSN